jgi:hypothetical protein
VTVVEVGIIPQQLGVFQAQTAGQQVPKIFPFEVIVFVCVQTRVTQVGKNVVLLEPDP